MSDVTQAWTTEMYRERLAKLSSASVSLDRDPVSGGLTSINAKIAEVQAQKDFVNQKLIEAIGNKVAREVDFKSTSFDYERKYDNLMQTDSDVYSQKSDAARRSAANVKIGQLVIDIHAKSLELARADNYLKAVYQIYNNLHSAQEGLSRQISVIQMGLSIKEITREELFALMPRILTVKKSENSE